MTTVNFLDPTFLVEEGPKGFTRQLERLLVLISFTDVLNIDGPGDKGADLIGRLKGEDWLFQAKWKKAGNVDFDAVDEAHAAMRHYDIHRAVVVTNRHFTQKAKNRAEALRDVGINITLWDGNRLSTIYERAPDRVKPFELHVYQDRAVEAAWQALDDAGEALVYLATGLGKTVVAGRVLRRFLLANPGAQVLVTAHMIDLVEQLERAMWRDIPKDVPTRLLHGSSKPNSLPGVTFGVAPTARDYIESGYSPGFVIVDEAHHVGETGNYATMLDRLPGAKRLGVTATPWRGDQYDIEQTFGEPVVRVSISEGMKLGYLAEVKYRLFAGEIDWDFVHEASEHGYTIKDLNRRLFIPERDEAVRAHLEEVWDQTTNPRAIIFCQTIEHAERMRDLLARRPGWERTETLHANVKSRQRRERLLKFRSGDVPILIAVDILNEGVDVPDVNILCFARVTHSRRIFVQQLGRGLRLRKGKTHVEVLDFVSDLRRLADLYDMRERVSEDEIEEVSLGRNQFIFEDLHVRDLLEKWMADVGDLGGADESVRLEFPPIEGGLMAAVPSDVRTEVIKELVRQFDAARWEEMSANAATEMYDRFVKDPKIGGRLSPYMPAEKVRVWIKDGPAKEYRRALEGVGPIAPFTNRAYPGPESVVRLSLGDAWVPKLDTLEEKPMRCFAEDSTGQAMFVIWGPLSALQALIWNSCLIRARDPLKPITVVVTKPNSAPLAAADWTLVKALSDIVNADCKQITYSVRLKPGA